MTGEDIIIVIDERTLEPVVVEGGEYYRGPAGADGHTPYIGINGNWWINGEDTGVNGTAPNMTIVEQYVQGYAEPKRGIDDFFVSAAQVILINDIVNKVTAITGHSLVADTEIAKIHRRNTDSTLLSENGLHSVYVDANGTFHVKDISQVGTTYETHAEQLFTTKNEIILRDGAIAGLGVGEYVGLRAKLYDGVNDGNLVFDKDGWARVGDVGALQKLATIEESPTNGHLMRYNTSTFRLESYDPLLLPVSTAASRQFVNQNGGTIYHITRWFTPSSALLIEAGGLTAQQVGATQFTAAMIGAKLKLTNGVNEPIITAVDVPNRRITLSFAVDASFFGQSVAVADWGVYGIERINTGGVVKIYGSTGTQIRQDGVNSNYLNSFSGLADEYSFSSNTAQLKSGYRFIWANGNFWYDTKDTGLFRPSAGLLQIYDGITTTALRDLKLRSLFADKIIPNSDTTGVAVTKSNGTTEVVKIDTTNGIVMMSKIAMNEFGGFMIRLTNKTGAASVKGSVVSLSAATPSAFVLQSNEFDAVGIVYEAGVSDGAECWVVVSGIAEVLLENNTASTMGNWVISSASDGRANATQPTPTPNSTINEHTTHFKEIGHCMETKAAGTNVLAKCVIHFN
jgi:hypothetical protein